MILPLAIAALVALALWWLGTGVVLYLQQRMDGQVRPRPLLHGGAVVALGALAVVALHVAGQRDGMIASLAGFTAAIVLWGTLELGHLLGLVTGPHSDPCPRDAGEGERFRLALGTSLWHELSVLGVGVLLLALLGGMPNPTGLYAYLVLWLMRWSAKLNLFFGVPNFSTAWFPAHLAHVATYIRHARISPFYPLSLTLAALGFVVLARLALSAPEAHALVHALPAALLALAVLEHVFMALPVADTRLWDRLFTPRRVAVEADPAESAARGGHVGHGDHGGPLARSAAFRHPARPEGNERAERAA